MYIEVVKSITSEYSNRNGVKPYKLVKSQLAKHNIEEQHKIIDFMSYIGHGKETYEGYAVVMFWKKASSKALETFAPQNNSLCQQYLKQQFQSQKK